MKQKKLSLYLRHFATLPSIRIGSVCIIVLTLIAISQSIFLWGPAVEIQQSLLTNVRENNVKLQLAVASRDNERAVGDTIHFLKIFDKKINTPVEQSAIINNLSNLAKKNGLTTLSETYEQRQTDEGFQSLSQELKMKGSYSSFRSFFSGLHDLPTWSLIKSFRLSRPKKYHRILQANLVVVTYYKESN